MKRTLTEFTFYYNTPFANFENTILFSQNSERDAFFDQTYYKLTFSSPFNFILDRSTIRVPSETVDYWNLQGYNYCRFVDNNSDILYYAFVMDIKYINANVTEISLLPDGIMTFCQGDTLNKLYNLTIEREHLPYSTYMKKRQEIRSNDDVLQCYSKHYFKTTTVNFTDFYLLIYSSCNLTADFGSEKDPKMVTSIGGTIDNITSPLDIYMVDRKDFKDFMIALSPYPWIAQNISKVVLMPKDFFSDGDFVHAATQFGFDKLYQLIGTKVNQTKKLNQALKEISFSQQELYDLFNLKFFGAERDYLLRPAYLGIEATTYDGQTMSIDTSKLTDGLQWESLRVLGYENEVACFIKDYNFRGRDTSVKKGKDFGSVHGRFLNDSLIFKNFDTIPVLTDSKGLALARTAHQRQLTESRLLTNRAKNVFNPNSDPLSRFMDAASLISNANPLSLAHGFTSEYEYYREQRAQQEDMGLEKPSMSEQLNSHSFAIANGFFGITLQFYEPDEEELEKIDKYYKTFGFEVKEENSRLEDVYSQTLMNYVKFSGNYQIKDCPLFINTMIESQFENGVKLWHNRGESYPFTQNLKYNINA